MRLQFVSEYQYVGRGFYPQSDLVSRDSDHGNDDRIAYANAFALSAGENEHESTSLST
jgi:hypothetical protein